MTDPNDQELVPEGNRWPTPIGPEDLGQHRLTMDVVPRHVLYYYVTMDELDNLGQEANGPTLLGAATFLLGISFTGWSIVQAGGLGDPWKFAVYWSVSLLSLIGGLLLCVLAFFAFKRGNERLERLKKSIQSRPVNPALLPEIPATAGAGAPE
jgi:hypothetical protein